MISSISLFVARSWLTALSPLSGVKTGLGTVFLGARVGSGLTKEKPKGKPFGGAPVILSAE